MVDINTNSANNLKKGPYGVFDEWTEAALEQAIQNAVPVDDEQRGHIGNEPEFEWCGWMQGVIPKSTDLQKMKPFAQRWYELSEDKLEDDCGDALTFSEIWSNIVESWHKVDHPKKNSLKTAQLLAKKATYKILELDWCKDEVILHLARVCYQLSLPDGKFFLSGGDAGDIIEKDQKTGRKALIMFGVEKIIKLIQKGYTGHASDYQYIGEPPVECPEKPPDQFEKRKRKMIDDVMATETDK